MAYRVARATTGRWAVEDYVGKEDGCRVFYDRGRALARAKSLNQADRVLAGQREADEGDRQRLFSGGESD